MMMIQSPSTDLWIQFCDQFSCRQVSAFLDVVSDLGEKRLDILLRWSDEELRAFPFLILAYRLAEKVKASFDMRNDRFLGGEDKSSFSHELLHKRFHFLFQ